MEQLGAFKSKAVLQFGHGGEAVETPSGAPCSRVRSRFNSATAVKPWKRVESPRGDRANRRFNSATAVKPWKRVANPIEEFA